MNSSIMNDNILYLNSLFQQYPRVKEGIELTQNAIKFQSGSITDEIEIQDFYVPEVFYNEQLRIELDNNPEFNAFDLFQTIKVSVILQDLKKLEKELEEAPVQNALENQQSVQPMPQPTPQVASLEQTIPNEPYIINMEIKENENSKYLVFTDSQNNHYKMNSSNPEGILNIYNNLKQTNPNITISNWKKALESLVS